MSPPIDKIDSGSSMAVDPSDRKLYLQSPDPEAVHRFDAALKAQPATPTRSAPENLRPTDGPSAISPRAPEKAYTPAEPSKAGVTMAKISEGGRQISPADFVATEAATSGSNDAEPDQVKFKPHEKKLLTENTVTGGTRPRLSRDYIYDSNSGDGEIGAFERRFSSDSFADPDKGKIEFRGGLRDDVRLQEALRPDGSPKVSVGESTRNYGGLVRALPHWGSSGEVGDENLGASYDAEAGLSATGSAETGFDRDGIRIGASGEVHAGVRANGEAQWSPLAGPAELSAKGEVRAGAGLSGDAGLNLDPTTGLTADIGAEAFAGVEAGAEGNVGVGDSGNIGGGGSLKAGIGAEFNADMDVSLDNIGGEFNVGATLGIGADVNVDLSISPVGIVNDAKDIGSAILGIWS